MKIAIIVIAILAIQSSFGAEVIERDGQTYITGSGCGIKTPMKTLYSMPENIQDFPCSIISKGRFL